MLAIKPAGDLDPAMKAALKNHILRKRQQLKQELEQDAIEKRLKREQEAKRKQDDMTIEQMNQEISKLEKHVSDCNDEKHSLFVQLKQTMRVSTEDDTRRKQKEGEINSTRTPQQMQNDQNHHHQQQQHNQQPQHQQHQQQQQQQPQLQQQQQQQQTVQPNSSTPTTINPAHPAINPTTHIPSNNGILPPTILANQENHAINRDNLKEHAKRTDPQNTQQQQQPQQQQQQPQVSHQQCKRPISAANLSNDMVLPSKKLHTAPQPQNPNQSTHPLSASSLSSPYMSHPGLPPNIGASSAGGSPLPASLFAGQNLMRTPPPPNISSLLNSAAFSHLLSAHNFPRQSPYLSHLQQPNRSSNPYGPMSPYQSIGGHPPPPSLISGHGIPTSLANVPQANQLIRPSPPISAANLSNDVGLSSKKLHTAPQVQTSNPSHPLSTASLSNPYMSHPGLPPNMGGTGAAGSQLPASLFASQNLMRTPPPPNISSLFNSAAFSHLLNAHNFPRQSPYLSHLQQPNRSSNPYGPMSPYQTLGGHPPPPSLISGHGLPTSMANVPQASQLIRPSPPPMSGNSTPLGGVGNGPKLGLLNLPISGAMDFANPNLTTSQAQQIQAQQAALNSQAAAAAAALGLPYGPPYFNHTHFS